MLLIVIGNDIFNAVREKFMFGFSTSLHKRKLKKLKTSLCSARVLPKLLYKITKHCNSDTRPVRICIQSVFTNENN